ncbi:MAG: bifunctional precorrin-2 dehydrogenase/sirohydrochlorin ferrochelatase [Pseudomonadota bacterium]
MRYYPVNLDIKNRKCLVVGGGAVGTRKVVTLLDCGAAVTVVSPEVTPKLLDLSNRGDISLEKRSFQAMDLEDTFLVIGATDNEELNRTLYSEAQRRGILCNIADRPEACNFILPSIVRRGDLIIAISTSGKSPAFAKKLRKEFEATLGEEYADFLKLMGAIRKKLLAEKHESEAHKHLFERLIRRDLVEMVKHRRTDDIDNLLSETLGPGYIFAELMEIDG